MAEFAERSKPRAQFVDEAINLALQSKWAEAAQVNRAILDRFGPEEETLNRLGKAYTELGQVDEAPPTRAASRPTRSTPSPRRTWPA